MTSRRTRLRLALFSAAVTLLACALLLAGYAYARARAFRDLDVVLEGDYGVEFDPEIGFVPARDAATVRRHPRSGLAYHVFTSDRRARVGRRGERTAPEVGLLSLGDSYGWGHGVESDQTYTSLLARRWATPAANLAFAAYGTVQSLEMLRRSLDLRPRLVLYDFIADHMRRNASPCAPAYGTLCLPWSHMGVNGDGQPVVRPAEPGLFEINRRFARDFFFTKSLGPRQVLTAAEAEWVRFARTPRGEVPDDPAMRQRILERLLGDMAGAAASVGAPLLVVHIPQFLGRGQSSPVPAPLRGALDRLRASNLQFLDLGPAVARHYADPAAGSLSFEHDGHPNPAAHALFAETIDGFLRQKGLVPAASAR